MKSQPCDRCGFLHAALGVSIDEGVLVRTVRKESQRVRAFGGAYGFIPRFWDVHCGSGDFDIVVIKDLARGEIWTADQRAIGSVRRETLSGAIGEQVLLLCSRMGRDADPELVRSRAPEQLQRPAQANFFGEVGRADPGTPRRARRQ